MSQCDKKKGLFGRRKKDSNLHPGDHDNGKTTWPRTGSDLHIYELALVEFERLQIERRQREELLNRINQDKLEEAEGGACNHTPKNHMEFDEIKQKGNPPYLYREFWNVSTCSKCGDQHREADEYYGDDMADIHWKWVPT